MLLVSSFLVFALCAASFDPLAKYRSRQPTAAARVLRARSATQLGLDKPFFVRYWHWLGGVLHGDFGNDINDQPVGRPAVAPAAGHRPA